MLLNLGRGPQESKCLLLPFSCGPLQKLGVIFELPNDMLLHSSVWSQNAAAKWKWTSVFKEGSLVSISLGWLKGFGPSVFVLWGKRVARRLQGLAEISRPIDLGSKFFSCSHPFEP